MLIGNLIDQQDTDEATELLYLRPSLPETHQSLSSFSKEAQDAIADDAGCAICRDKIEDPTALDCNVHAYCHGCIAEHLNTAQDRTCPLCRTEVTRIT